MYGRHPSTHAGSQGGASLGETLETPRSKPGPLSASPVGILLPDAPDRHVWPLSKPQALLPRSAVFDHFPGLPLVAQRVKKESACNAGDRGSIPGSGRSPGEGNDNLFQYSCLENPHGQWSLVGYSPRGCKDQDTTERLNATHISSLAPPLVLLQPFQHGSQTAHPSSPCSQSSISSKSLAPSAVCRLPLTHLPSHCSDTGAQARLRAFARVWAAPSQALTSLSAPTPTGPSESEPFPCPNKLQLLSFPP